MTGLGHRTTLRLALLLTVALAGCGGTSDQSAPTEPVAVQDHGREGEDHDEEAEDGDEAQHQAQTYNEGVEMLCNGWMAIEEQIGSAPAADRNSLVLDWIDRHLENEQARELMETMKSVPPAEGVVILQREAQSAGVGECLLLD